MKRQIKNNGEYLEVDADALVSKLDEMIKAEIVVINKERIEFAGEDKILFLKRLESFLKLNSNEISSFSDAQKSDYLIRKMLLEDILDLTTISEGVSSES